MADKESASDKSIEAGKWLADLLIRSVDPAQQAADHFAVLESVLAQGEHFVQVLHLGLIGKWQLLTTFRRRLRASQLGAAVANKAQRGLGLRLFFGAGAALGREPILLLRETRGEVQFFFERGNDYFSVGLTEDAIACYRRVLQLSPSHAQAHAKLGVASIAVGADVDAIEYFSRAVALAPDLFAAYLDLGITLERQHRLAEAREVYQRAAAVRSDNFSQLMMLGFRCWKIDLDTEAENCFRRALDINPANADALFGMGSVLKQKARFAEAEECFRRVLAVQPKQPAAWTSLPGLRKMTPADAGWMETAEEIVRDVTDSETEAFLRFAMGKYCDDVKDYARAFTNFRRGHEIIRPAAGRYDREGHENLLEKTICAYGPGRLLQARAGGSLSARPVFVVGMMRSGTSLVEQIIASHPAAAGAGEMLYWGECFGKNHGAILAAGLDQARVRELADGYLALLAEVSADAQRVVDKMPTNFSVLGFIHEVFPHARIVHVRRHPVDTCLSIYFQNFGTKFAFANDLGDLAHYYRQYHRLMDHWRTVLPPEVFLEISYEDLVADQRACSHKIVEFLGLDWDERCMDFHKTERDVRTASYWQVRQPLYRTSVERWRNYAPFINPLIALLDLLPEVGVTENPCSIID